MTSPNKPPSTNPPGSKVTRPNPQSTYSPPPTYRARPPAPGYRARPGTAPHPVQRIDPQADFLRARYKGQHRRNRMRFIVLTVFSIMSITGIALYLYLSNVFVNVGKVLEIFRPQVPVHVDANGTPIPVVYPNWGNDPVNILLIGLDYRPGDEDTRADTQIVVHVDPVSKSAAMVALPRDMWVPIPGFGEGRINAAYQLGDTNRDTIEGGGPVLAMSTIEQNLGIKIQYYAKVDFTGFEEIINTIGGLTIDVPRPLVDNEYPLGDHGVTRLYIPAGLQHMDGRTALSYARSRHADSDLGRNTRQQQVLLAIKQQGLNLNLLTKLNELSTQLSTSIETNLSITQTGSLATLAKDFGPDAIQTVNITADMVTETIIQPTGADVLIPNWDLIRPLISQAFADPRLAKEAARLSVVNGTEVPGIGKSVRDKLVAEGFNIPDLRSKSPDVPSYTTTEITDFTGGQKPRTIEALCRSLKLDCSQVKQAPADQAPISQTDNKPVDIMVVAGEDKIK